MRGEANENYLRVAVALWHRLRRDGQRTVLFSSAKRGEGTTTAVLNVARHLKKTCGLNPLVVELDAQRPVLGRLFGLDPARNLQAVAEGRLSPRECIQPSSAEVAMIPAGQSPGWNGARSGLAAVLQRVVAELGPEFDVILFDTPPILQNADAMAAAALVPRLVLVVEAGRTRYEMLDRVKGELAGANITILGAILNKHKRFIPGWLYRAFVR